MSEIKIITCDVCGQAVKYGFTLTNSNRRRISMTMRQQAAFRFDICDRCFERIKKECRKERKETEGNDDKRPGQ